MTMARLKKVKKSTAAAVAVGTSRGRQIGGSLRLQMHIVCLMYKVRLLLFFFFFVCLLACLS